LADLHVQLGNTVKAVQILQALLQEYPADIEVQDQLDRIKSHQALENIEDIDNNIQYKTFDHCCGSTAKDLAGPQERQKNQRPCSNQHPESKKKCSIIIPVFNKVEFTRQCITALRENTPEDLYELIVVDNNSTDATPEYLCSIGGNVKILSNKENLGFAKACNQGANAASGKYFVFLNNDTVPHSGWLNALVKVAEEQQDIGVVGSKLLFPDGTIQHAGVVLIETPRGKLGSHLYWGYPGNFVPANRARDFQVVTAACMLISKDLFFCVNGFDEKYINGLEDVDLCLKVRNLGKRVFYCPHSILTHFESKTVGRFDNVNHNEKLFVELWNDKIEPDKHKYLLADGFRFENHDGRISWIYHRELFGTLLSIVVCIQNSSQQFQELIKDIQTNTLVPFEIIIVDNCCAMDSQEYLEDAVDIQRIRMKNNANLAQCYNRAKEKAKGDYIVFLTSGVLLTKGWASRMILNFKDNIGAVSCLAYSRDDLMLLKNLMIHPVTKECDFNQLAWLISTWNQARQTECEYIDRGCWIIRKDIIDRIGDFDENRFAEIVELEFSLRLGKNGYKVIRAADILIYTEQEYPAHIAGKQSRNGSLQSDVSTLAEALTEKYAKKVESGLIERYVHLPDVPFRSSELPDLPLTSIIILTFNQLPYTQKCLDSIRKFTTIPYELIIVDNGSTDGTIRYLKKYSEKYTNVRLILNEVNQGFAAGNNQGIEQAQGKYILFLNNDTVVTKGWLSRMIAHLERYPEAGMVGPVSNAVPVPQLIRSVPYGDDLKKMHAFAAKIARKNTGKITPFVRLVGFCLLAKK
ncbi:glycosyltransferase, partial [bacterium]